MKLATRTHRILAILMGIAMLVVLVLQMYREGYRLETKQIKTIQSNTI